MFPDADTLDPRLEELKRTWPAALWKARLAEAHARVAALEAIDAAIAGGMREAEALATVGGGLHRSTYLGRKRRHREGGFVAVFNKRPPPPPEELKATPAMRDAICIMRVADPDVSVERIAEVLARRFEMVPSPTVIKRVLAQEGLGRPSGPGRVSPAKQEQHEYLFAGAEFLRLADEELGYGAAMTSVITTAAREVAAAAVAPAEPAVAVGRDAAGHFTAESNAANAKGDAALGPAWRSVEVKRKEVDLGSRRLATEAPATVAGKVSALLAVPYLTDTGRALALDTYQAHAGLAEACGTAYAGSTLDRFLRDLKYLGLGQMLVEAHARFWQAHEPEAGTKPAALCLYLDASNKALWTDKFTRCGKVSANGRVMPCLEQALVHTGMGTPLYWQATSGHESLVKQAIPLLERVEATVGTGWMAGKILVIDGEGAAVDLLRALDDADREYVTILREGQVSGPEVVKDLTAWEPYRDGDEVAEGTFTLAAKSKAPYEVRVVLLRRVRAGQLTVLATSVPPATFDAREVADAYFDRWPKQELRFRTFSQGAHFKRVHGYGKQLVTNVTVVTKLDKLAAQCKRIEKRIKGQAAVVATAYAALKEAGKGVKKAEARRAKQDGRIATELFADAPDPNVVCRQVDALIAERDCLAEAKARAAEARTTHGEAVVRLATLRAELPKLAEKEALLASRREIYQADTELDLVMTAFKLGFVLLAEAALRLYFAGQRMSLDGFIRYVLAAPGTRVVGATNVTIRFKPSPNKQVQAALVAACAHVTSLERRRDGKLLRMEVEDPPGRNQRSRAAS